MTGGCLCCRQIANVSAALDTKGMLEETVWIVTADNGGPLDHSYNWPLRGGKHTLWEGGKYTNKQPLRVTSSDRVCLLAGLRGEAFVYSKSCMVNEMKRLRLAVSCCYN